jgi:hypothetical protein
VELDAESVYDAAIRGLALLRRDGWVDNVASASELEVEVREPATRQHGLSPAVAAVVRQHSGEPG